MGAKTTKKKKAATPKRSGASAAMKSKVAGGEKKMAERATLSFTNPSASRLYQRALSPETFLSKPFFAFKPNFMPNFMEDIMASSTKQFTGKSFDKMGGDAASFGQDGMEAATRSIAVFNREMEGIVKTCIEMTQTYTEKAAEATKTMMGCKTLNELTEAQTKFAQVTFDDFMTGATKISELGVKMFTTALEPVNDQVGRAVKKATDSMAA